MASWGMGYLYHGSVILVQISPFTVLLYGMQPDYEVHWEPPSRKTHAIGDPLWAILEPDGG